MSDLDKLFKKKLAQRSFEFKDAYWQAAELLIEAEEGKRRRRLGWWIFGGLLLLGLTAGAIYYSLVQPALISTGVPGEPLATTEKTKKNLLPLDAATADLNTEALNEQDRTKESEGSTTLSSMQNTQIKSGTGYVAEPRRSDAIETSTREYKKNTNAKNDPNTLIDNSITSILSAKDKTVSEPDQAMQTSGQADEESRSAGDTAVPLSKSEKTTPVAALALLEIRAPALLDNTFEARVPEMIVKKLATKRWQLGVDLATLYNFSASFRGYTGWALGTSVDYKLNRHWSLQGGLRYSIREPQNLAKPQNEEDAAFLGAALDETVGTFISTTNYYNFGLIQVNEITSVSQFHFIELPIHVQFRTNRHLFGAGWQLNYISGIRGSQTLQTTPSNLSPNTGGVSYLVPGSNKNGWLDRSLYNKWSSELHMNYGFILHPRWSIHLGANYQLFDNGLVNTKRLEQNIALNQQLQPAVENNRLYFRLGMRYRIGK